MKWSQVITTYVKKMLRFISDTLKTDVTTFNWSGNSASTSIPYRYDLFTIFQLRPQSKKFCVENDPEKCWYSVGGM